MGRQVHELDTTALPAGRTVVELTFHGIEPALRDWWLLLSRDEVDVCDEDPGLAPDLAIDTPIRTFVGVWRGDIGWDDALRGGDMRLRGPEQLRRQVPDWFQLSHFAGVER